MRVAVWGGGEIGTALAYRLTTLASVSSLLWINRTFHNIHYRVIDLEHGLAFAPSCHEITAATEREAAEGLEDVDLLIVTTGASVPPGEPREAVYAKNRDVLRQTVIPTLKQGFHGLVLVVTNPVDLMARLVRSDCRLEDPQVMGLGTVVETARLRSSLGSYMIPMRPAREVWAYAVGTHDPNFVPVVTGGLGPGSAASDDGPEIVDLARREVANAAARVKLDRRSTLHPVIEGAAAVVDAVGHDRRALLTVSVHDPETAEGLFYSVPCTLGRDGVLERHLGVLREPDVAAGIRRGCDGLRQTLRAAGDL